MAIRIRVVHMLGMHLHAIRMRICMQMQSRALKNEQRNCREQQDQTGESAHLKTIARTGPMSLREGRRLSAISQAART